jgi:hypothetical protein
MKKHLTLVFALLTILSTSAHAQLPSYLPADGLVGWWPFNGNANDESGNGNDGVVNGSTLAEDRLGNAGSAYSFDGVDDYIDYGDVGFLDNSVFATWNWWFLSEEILPVDGSNDYVSVIRKDLSWIPMQFANDSYDYYRSLLFQGGIGGGNLIWDSSAIDYSNWTMYTLCKTSNSIMLYKNGALLDSLSYVGLIENSASPFLLGRAYTFNNLEAFSGLLDDIAIYNRALTEQEIQNLYTATNTGNTVDTGNGAAPLPQGIPYQAAARDANGQPVVDSPLNVRFSLREGAADGATSYIESHSLTTNSIGLFNTVFGNGTPEQSAFDSINWAATTKFLQVEVDLGNGYLDMGTTQLLSVPYAFRSAQAANIKNAALPVYPDNTAALAGGLVAGEMYRTATGDLKIAY